jgi:hypothetical protein
MKVLRTLLAAGFVVLAVSTAIAQTGGMRVTVYDAADKSPLPGATVVLRNSQQLVAMTTVITNKSGIADFPVLRAGSGYSLEVSFISYAKQQMANIRVPINQVQSVSFILAPETVEKVVVEAHRETVDLEKTSTSTKFGEDFIQDLPVQGRFYQNVLTMAAGVQDADGDGNPNVNGARSTDFKAEVGGVSNQDPLTGMQMSQVNPDSIEEIEVITAGAGVEFGRAQGGFANIIQKQGSNDFEGTFNFLYTSSLLDGGAASFPGAPLPKYDHYEPALQLSGPIVKDKLWYRLSHEYIQQQEPVPTNAGSVNVTTKRQINSDAVTWQVSPRNKLQLTYSADPLTVTNWGVSRLVPAESSSRREIGGPTYRLGWTAPFSAKILVDSLVSYQDHHTNILPMSSGKPNNCVPENATISILRYAQCTNLDSGQVSGSGFLTWRDKSQRLTVRSTASIFGGHFLGMDHQFKVGLSVENERYYRSEIRKPDIYYYVYSSLQNNQNANQSPTLLYVFQGRFAVPQASYSRSTDTATAVFVEDQVKPRQNLSITLGLRLDREALNAPGYQPFDPSSEQERYLVARAAAARSFAVDYLASHPDANKDADAVLVDMFNNPNASGYSEFFASDDLLTARYSSFTAFEGVQSFEDSLSEQTGVDLSGRFSGALTNSKSWTQKRQAGDIDIANSDFGYHFALSWDPWSDGKTKLAMSVRRMYGTIPLNVALSETEPAIVSVRLTAQKTEDNPTLDPKLSQKINATAATQVVRRDLKTPYNDEITLSWEREIFAETSAKLTFIYRKYVNQFQDFDLNHYPADYGRCHTQSNTAIHDWIVGPSAGSTKMEFGADGRPLGDGNLDDCDGQLTYPFTPQGSDGGGGEGGSTGPADLRQMLHGADGYLDTYIYNIGWGAIYQLGNYNNAKYKGLQLEIVRRQYRNWQMNASYTWSRALGNGESWNSYLGDDRTTRDQEFGYLSYDVRHALKINATTITPWGFRAGTAISWQSGLPYSILEQKPTADAAPVWTEMTGLGEPEPRTRLRYPTHQRNDQRNRAYWNFDLKLDKEMNLGKGMNLQVALDVFNLLNDRTYQIWNPFSEEGDQVNGYNDGYQRIGRNYQVSMKLSF